VKWTDIRLYAGPDYSGLYTIVASGRANFFSHFRPTRLFLRWHTVCPPLSDNVS